MLPNFVDNHLSDDGEVVRFNAPFGLYLARRFLALITVRG
jgi:hypothetical protein